MTTPVSPSLAKLLKEKGFDIPCREYYFKEELNSSTKDNWNQFYVISAPTIAEVLMWLKDKYGVWIIVECDCCGELWFFSTKSASKTTWEDLDKRYVLSSWNREFNNESKSPKEAYEKAITYLLNKDLKQNGKV